MARAFWGDQMLTPQKPRQLYIHRLGSLHYLIGANQECVIWAKVSLTWSMATVYTASWLARRGTSSTQPASEILSCLVQAFRALC
jgi:hypothetical protein